jgi:hypothetical protein
MSNDFRVLTRIRCRAVLRVAAVAVLSLAAFSNPARAGFDDELVAVLNRAGGRIKRDKEPTYAGEFRPIVEVSFKADAKFADAWPHLVQLPSLAVVSFANVKAFGDADAKHLAQLAALRSVSLAGTRVTDDGLRILAGLDTLESIELAGTAVTDEGLAHLVGLRELRYLGLNATKVTGEGLQHLSKLDRLEELCLADTTVGDDTVNHLAKLSGLKSVKLERARLTPEGVKKLQAARPQLHIDTGSTADPAQAAGGAPPGPVAAAADAEKNLLLMGHSGSRLAFLRVPDPLDAVIAATNAVRNGQVIITGTVTSNGPGAQPGYEAAPSDRLVWKQAGAAAVEYTITQLAGDLSNTGSFLIANHTLTYRVTVEKGMEVAVEMSRNRGQLHKKLKGWITLPGGRYDIDLLMSGTTSFESDSFGHEQKDWRTFVGTIKNANLELTVHEVENFQSVGSRRETVTFDSRTVNNKIVAGDTTYQWNNVYLKKTFKNGKITGADRGGWGCTGEVTAGGRRIAVYKKDLEAYPRAPAGSKILFTIEAANGANVVESWRLPSEYPEIP